jgi:hypothetical protein
MTTGALINVRRTIFKYSQTERESWSHFFVSIVTVFAPRSVLVVLSFCCCCRRLAATGTIHNQLLASYTTHTQRIGIQPTQPNPTMSDEQEIIECFKVLDTDNKGSIKTSDLRQILETFGDKMKSSDIDQMIDDAGGGSSIDYVSFVRSYNKKVAAAMKDV